MIEVVPGTSTGHQRCDEQAAWASSSAQNLSTRPYLRLKFRAEHIQTLQIIADHPKLNKREIVAFGESRREQDEIRRALVDLETVFLIEKQGTRFVLTTKGRDFLDRVHVGEVPA